MPIHWTAEQPLTRRRFLAGAAAGLLGGCTPLYSRRRQPPLGEQRDTRWVFLADTHIHRSPDKTVRRCNMARNLRSAVAHVLAGAPEHVLFNGDMAFARGKLEDYATFEQVIAPLREKPISMHFTLGNHDHRDNFISSRRDRTCRLVNEKCISSLVIGSFRWVFLDSLRRVDEFSGALGEGQLIWLANRLDAAQDVPAIVCLHHNPEPTLFGLKDTSAFLDVVLPRRQIKAVIFGHTHAYRHWQVDGLHFVNLPAVGYWFSPSTPLGWISASIALRGITLDVYELVGTGRRESIRHTTTARLLLR